MAQELYKFVLDATEWYFTSGDDAVDYLGNTYEPTPIIRTDKQLQKELNKSNIHVTLDIPNAVSQKYLTDQPYSVMALTIFETTDGGTTVGWQGRLVGYGLAGQKVKFTFETIFTSMRRAGVRRRFSKTCTHTLFGRGCGVDKALFKTVATATAATNSVITVTEAALQPDGYYTGGMVESGAGSLGFIIDHTGTQLTAQGNNSEIKDEITLGAGSASIFIYAGCNKTRSACETKFDNLINNGGFAWVPDENPMTGTSIY